MSVPRSAWMLLLMVAFATAGLRAQSSASKSARKAPPASSLQATLVDREKAGWDAFKVKDRKAFSALATPDYTAVFADGSVADLAGSLDAMAASTINHYSLSDFRVTALGPDAALVTYNASENLTVGKGPAQDMKLAVTDVWVKRAGQWKAIRYHESSMK